jgi:hypothetical protein
MKRVKVAMRKTQACKQSRKQSEHLKIGIRHKIATTASNPTKQKLRLVSEHKFQQQTLRLGLGGERGGQRLGRREYDRESHLRVM